MRWLVPICTIAVALAGCNQSGPVVSKGAVDRAPSANTPAAPDNTAVNQRDAQAPTKTPIDQKENQADVDLTAKIRQKVLDVKDLSINARNAKIITADGKVTLRGPVNSVEERETLAKIASDIAGVGNVDNQLEVASANTAQR